MEAHQSDATICATLSILEELRQAVPKVLITIENPRHSVFDRHIKVRELLATGKWRLLESTHCATANEDLDGKVTAHPESRGLFPDKRTWWLTTGLPKQATMSVCKSDCWMLVP